MNFSRLSIGGFMAKVKGVGTFASAECGANAPPISPAAPARN
jgi:hypothetical protein